MKRSEMLEIIKRCWVDSTSFPTDDLVAKYILSIIEQKGMLPPQRQVIDITSLGVAGFFAHTENSWEPEDE